MHNTEEYSSTIQILFQDIQGGQKQIMECLKLHPIGGFQVSIKHLQERKHMTKR